MTTAPKKTASNVKPAGRFGLVKQKGWHAALDNTLAEVTMKQGKSFPFAKISVMAGGAVAVGHGLLADKDNMGEDRSALSRLVEIVVGGGLIAGGALAGRAV